MAVQTGILRRKCASCSNHRIAGGECKECEKKKSNLQRTSSNSARQTKVPAIVHEVLNTSGQPLDKSTRAFFETRFAHNFSHVPLSSTSKTMSHSSLKIGEPTDVYEQEAERVADSVMLKTGQENKTLATNDRQNGTFDLSQVRIHTDARAARSAHEVNAQAFTFGKDIVFGTGQFAPATREGRRLIAHELTHVAQQGEGTLRRKLNVENAKDNIDNPGGKGLVQTKAQTIENYLQTLCSGGSVKVDKGSGKVSLAAGYCPVPMAVGEMGPPAPAPSDKSKEPTGCNCLCDMIGSSNNYKIVVDDSSWPHTSGLVVTAPSPNSPKLWGAATVSGKKTYIDPWLVLGHELCGHAWLDEMGLPDSNANRGEGGHQEAVGRENLIRDEHGIENRGGFKDPYCGESFWQKKAGPGPIVWSSYLAKCKAWRKKNYGAKYKISDKIP